MARAHRARPSSTRRATSNRAGPRRGIPDAPLPAYRVRGYRSVTSERTVVVGTCRMPSNARTTGVCR